MDEAESLDLRRIEEAAMNAWPALQTVLFDGWVLRFAGGYTKRANSVNPTYPSTCGDLEDNVVNCEQVYERFGLPSIFRLTSFGAPAGLDQLLEERGYRFFDRSLVLQRSLPEPLPELREGLSLRDSDVDEWLDRYVALSGSALDKRDAHLAILRRIPGDARFATLWDERIGAPVACGLAVAEQGLVGLYDVVTDREQRNRGFGSALVTSLLNWSIDQGARDAYLQVVAANDPAVALYRKLGFREAYHYWYRMPAVVG